MKRYASLLCFLALAGCPLPFAERGEENIERAKVVIRRWSTPVDAEPNQSTPDDTQGASATPSRSGCPIPHCAAKVCDQDGRNCMCNGCGQPCP